MNEVKVPDYWIVDAKIRTITVVRPGAADTVITDRFEWSPPGVAATLEGIWLMCSARRRDAPMAALAARRQDGISRQKDLPTRRAFQ